ncbi:MAG: hypothetical protein ACLVBP_15465 [Ruminococcus sp.]
MNQAQQNATSIAFWWYQRTGSKSISYINAILRRRLQKYTDVAANSEGSGEQKFDLYLEGLGGKD